MKSIILSFLVICTINVFALDPHFDQINNTSMYHNPAYAGTSGGARIIASGRSQWARIPGGGYQTAFFSYDQYFKSMRGGVGINYYHDKGGAMKADVLDFIYAPHIIIKNKIIIKPSIGLGLYQHSVDFTGLTWGSMYDPQTGAVNYSNAPSGKEKIVTYDVSTGLLVYTKKLYFGASVNHLTEPELRRKTPNYIYGLYSFNLSRRYTYHGGYSFIINPEKQFSITPSFLLMYQNSASSIIGTITARYKYFLLGAGYRINDALVMNAGFEFKFFRLSYSYDYTVSSLTNSISGGANEVSLIFWIKARKEKNQILALRPSAF